MNRNFTSIEVENTIKDVKTTHAETGFIPENFDKDNPHDYSRNWFAWANTLFGKLILKIFNENREILLEEF